MPGRSAHGCVREEGVSAIELFRPIHEALIALAQDRAMERLTATERQDLLVSLKADLGGEVFMDRVDFVAHHSQSFRQYQGCIHVVIHH